MLSANGSALPFTGQISTKIVLTEAEIFTNWQRQRQVVAEVKKYHVTATTVSPQTRMLASIVSHLREPSSVNISNQF